MSVCWSEVRRLHNAAMNTFRSIVTGAALLTLPAEAQVHRFETDPVVTVRENFVACDVLTITARHGRPPFSTYWRMRAAERRPPGSYLRNPRAICLYLSGKHDHAVQMDARESVVEVSDEQQTNSLATVQASADGFLT